MAGEAFTCSTVHTFIVPNFKENIEVLQQTVEFISKHPNAGSYCVMLAM